MSEDQIDVTLVAGKARRAIAEKHPGSHMSQLKEEDILIVVYQYGEALAKIRAKRQKDFKEDFLKNSSKPIIK